MIRSLYDWTMTLAARRDAVWALAIVSFVESSFFPIPPDLLLIPMVLAQRARAWLLAGVCTLSSVAGGLFGSLRWDTPSGPSIVVAALLLFAVTRFRRPRPARR